MEGHQHQKNIIHDLKDTRGLLNVKLMFLNEFEVGH